MFSVALIGADGAGKSTISRELEKSFPYPLRVLYMGVRLDSSNVLLPTSRFIQLLKRMRNRPTGNIPDRLPSPFRDRTRSQKLRSNLRIINLLAEEWYRQLLSWHYQSKAWVVVYDRHFIFDFENGGPEAQGRRRGFIDRMHRWYLHTLYPRPDLVIFLDAPAEVLFDRKRELSIQLLDLQRQAFLREGNKTPNFIRIDATQPLDTVYTQVTDHILQFYRQKQQGTQTC